MGDLEEELANIQTSINSERAAIETASSSGKDQHQVAVQVTGLADEGIVLVLKYGMLVVLQRMCAISFSLRYRFSCHECRLDPALRCPS